MKQKDRYLNLLSLQYQNRFAVYTKLINLSAILNMPKGTEHFISDIHGEYEAFLHIINNGSGVIKEKVKLIFKDFSKKEVDDFCSLIYYPKEVLSVQEKACKDKLDLRFYKNTIDKLIILINFLSSKYSRTKVRKLMDVDFAFIIDELMHAKSDEHNSRHQYHQHILKSIIQSGCADDFIIALCALVKRLSVDKLHVLGDIFDRGLNPDKCMDLLMQCHDLDMQWGNHDVLWMGACCGSPICAVNILCNNLRYHNFKMLENGYGISLRKLAIFAQNTYQDEDHFPAVEKAIAVICVKLIGQLVKRHPEYHMEDRLVLDKLNLDKGTVTLFDGKEYELKTRDLVTIDKTDPYKLTGEEQEVVDDLVSSFTGSVRLKEHIEFLYSKGTMYKCFNGNLLYHGCIPLDSNGQFEKIECDGKWLSAQEYLDYCDQKVRKAYHQRDLAHLDFLWYMWTGDKSPLSGRKMKLFERMFVKDPATYDEPRNPYYDYYRNKDTCCMILKAFNLDPNKGHIINGHTPILVKDGQSPIGAEGKLLVIDGGFCKAYQAKTGIAGYTLIYSSHELQLKAHTPFVGVKAAIYNNADIGDIHILDVEKFEKRQMVKDTDKGKEIKQLINDLKDLLELYKKGVLVEKQTTSEDSDFS